MYSSKILVLTVFTKNVSKSQWQCPGKSYGILALPISRNTALCDKEGAELDKTPLFNTKKLAYLAR